ncbi:MAG: MFS transporter [Nitrososphaerota archaeon]
MANRAGDVLFRNIILLGIVSFLQDVSSEMVHAVLPLFLVGIGAGSIIIGLIGGIGDMLTSLGNLLSGVYSDVLGKKKPLTFSGYAASAVAKGLLVVASAWQHVLVYRVIDRAGKGIRTAPRDALLSASMSSKRRGWGFGLHRAMDTSGAVLGSALAFVTAWIFKIPYNYIFLIAVLLAFLALTPFPAIVERSTQTKTSKISLQLKGLPSSLKAFIFIASLFTLSNFSYMFFILRAARGVDAELLSLILYVIFNVSYAVSAFPFGIVSDKLGRVPVLFLGYLLFSLTCLGFSVLEGTMWLFVLFIAYGLSYALFDGNQRAMVSDLSPSSARGAAFGVFHALASIATLLSSLIAGWLWEAFGTYATFLYGATLSAISAVALLVLRFRLHRVS